MQFIPLSLLPVISKMQINLLENSGISTNTAFFRDGLVLEIFGNVILPDYSAERIIRVASVGCSTGEEAYSLLLKNWGRRIGIRIDGYDVSHGNIEAALTAEYKLLVDSPVDLMKFEQLGLPCPEEAYILTDCEDIYHKHISFTPEVRMRINFANHDILETRLPKTYDVVLLLNVLRHFPEKDREIILANLFDSVDDDGWLICESAVWKDPDEERESYCRWMADISRFGFEKQHITLPGYFMEDQTSFSQVYRKKSN